MRREDLGGAVSGETKNVARAQGAKDASALSLPGGEVDGTAGGKAAGVGVAVEEHDDWGAGRQKIAGEVAGEAARGEKDGRCAGADVVFRVKPTLTFLLAVEQARECADREVDGFCRGLGGCAAGGRDGEVRDLALQVSDEVLLVLDRAA
jgi:hypothetical protein